jgi:hypothetical protein
MKGHCLLLDIRKNNSLRIATKILTYGIIATVRKPERSGTGIIICPRMCQYIFAGIDGGVERYRGFVIIGIDELFSDWFPRGSPALRGRGGAERQVRERRATGHRKEADGKIFFASLYNLGYKSTRG